YEALSYTWGDPRVTEPVLLNGQEYHATTNLRCALEYLRLPDRKRTLWVDALCINQADNDERCREVQRMGDIYSKAERLTVWLGDYGDFKRLGLLVP
ncbi:heterokaryon incompatibility, partial [Diplogelasinospora grovesii]